MFPLQLWRWVLWIASSIGMSYVTSSLLSLLSLIVDRHLGLHRRVVFLTVSLKPPALLFLQARCVHALRALVSSGRAESWQWRSPCRFRFFSLSLFQGGVTSSGPHHAQGVAEPKCLVQAVQTSGLLVAFCSQHSKRADYLYSTILKVTQCAAIFTGVQLLKTALARAASSYFYKSRCRHQPCRAPHLTLLACPANPLVAAIPCRQESSAISSLPTAAVHQPASLALADSPIL